MVQFSAAVIANFKKQNLEKVVSEVLCFYLWCMKLNFTQCDIINTYYMLTRKKNQKLQIQGR